MLQEIKTTGAS